MKNLFNSCVFLFSKFFSHSRSGLGISVLSMDIEWLGLTSLKKVRNGDIALGWNTKLCYIEDLDLSPIFAFPTQRLRLKENKDQKECGKYKAAFGAGHKTFLTPI